MINSTHDKKLKKLLVSLNNRLTPTVYFICCNTEKLRKIIFKEIESGTKRYRHIEVDLTPHLVYSLRDAINQFVSEEVKSSAPLSYAVHFTGISSSLFVSDGQQLKKSKLAEELNFERERLFHDYPFITFVWVTPYFYNELFYKAGDLMSWAVDRYEFIDNLPEDITSEIPYKQPLQTKGVNKERLDRIEKLENLLDRLNEENPRPRESYQ